MVNLFGWLCLKEQNLSVLCREFQQCAERGERFVSHLRAVKKENPL